MKPWIEVALDSATKQAVGYGVFYTFLWDNTSRRMLYFTPRGLEPSIEPAGYDYPCVQWRPYISDEDRREVGRMLREAWEAQSFHFHDHNGALEQVIRQLEAGRIV